MQFHRAHLRQVQQSFNRITDHVIRVLVGIGDLHHAQAGARFLEEVFLEEGLRAVRVAQDGQRPVLVMRHGGIAHGREVFREFELGDAVMWVQHAAGVREALAADLGLAVARGAGRPLRAGRCLAARRLPNCRPGTLA